MPQMPFEVKLFTLTAFTIITLAKVGLNLYQLNEEYLLMCIDGRNTDFLPHAYNL